MMSPRNRMIAAAAMAAASIVVAVVGYLGVSGEAEVAFQLPYFASAAVAALMLLGGAVGLVISGQLQRDGERLAELEEAVRTMATELGRLSDGLDARLADPESQRTHLRAS